MEQAGKERDFGSLRLDFHSLGDLQILLEFPEKRVVIALEKGDRDEQRNAYRYLDNLYFSMGDFRKATEYHEKRSKIARDL